MTYYKNSVRHLSVQAKDRFRLLICRNVITYIWTQLQKLTCCCADAFWTSRNIFIVPFGTRSQSN